MFLVDIGVRNNLLMNTDNTPESSRFITKNGIKVPAVTEAGMREVDRIAIEETGPNLYQMMENAGRNLALQCIDMLGAGWESKCIVVLAGTGGNGGGGICAARHLANRGAIVKLCVSDVTRLKEVPAFQYMVFRNTGSTEIRLEELESESPELIVDAIIGYSLYAAPYGVPLSMINWANATNCPVLSLDIPSGVDSTSGETPGDYIRANRTMTLALPKTGLREESAGDLYLSDIGIPIAVYMRLGLSYVAPFSGSYVVEIEYE